MKFRFFAVLLVIVMSFSVFVSCCKQVDSDGFEDIVILFTNDVHCVIDDNIGYSGLAAYKNYVESIVDNVLLVDCGDAIQGSFIGTVSKGEYIIDIMNEIGYDFAVPGNHEFDYGMEQLGKLIEQSEAQYLGCNIEYSGNGENELDKIKPWDIVSFDGVDIGFVGVLTPTTVTSSRPTYFMENGEYVYDFMRDDHGAELYGAVQESVDECIEAGADYVVVLSHLGCGEESKPYTSLDLIGATDGIDVVLDGHSHSVIPSQIEMNKNGEEVLLASTGEYLNNIGQLLITDDGILCTTLVCNYSQKDPEFTTYIDSVKARYDGDLVNIVASSDIELKGYDESGVRLVRNRETTIGNFCADAYRIVSGADIGMVNGGGIRADLPAGDISYADMLNVHPFGNMLCIVEATGQEIVDCLEVASRNTRSITSEGSEWVGEDGSYQQVSGIKYTIDTSIESTVVIENDFFVEVSGERRVKDVLVLNENGEYEPIDLNKIYTVASHDYLIKSGGDGMNMFVDNKLLMDEGLLDYQVLVTYITEHLGGNLGDKYSSVEGRITVE